MLICGEIDAGRSEKMILGEMVVVVGVDQPVSRFL